MEMIGRIRQERKKRPKDPLGRGALLFFLSFVASGLLMGCEGMSTEGDSADDLEGLPKREVQESVRLGGMDNVPEEEIFQTEPPLVADDQDRVFVLHSWAGRVAVFDADGDFLNWIGQGVGEGPREFTSAGSLGLLGDTLWVRNLTPPRISTFLPDGTHVSTVNVLMDVGYRTTVGVQGISGYLRGGGAWMEPDGGLLSENDEDGAPVVIGDRRLEAKDTVITVPHRTIELDAFPEPPYYSVAPDGSGVVVAEWSDAHPGELQVRWISGDRDRGEDTVLEVSPTPVPADVRDSLIAAHVEESEEIRERVIAQGIPEEEAPSVPTTSEVEANAYIPDYAPPIRGVHAGPEGTIWLLTSYGFEKGDWVALEAGDPVFRVTLPEGADLNFGTSKSIWGTKTGEHDVPYVIRWNVR